jgi:hypothetical protein
MKIRRAEEHKTRGQRKRERAPHCHFIHFIQYISLFQTEFLCFWRETVQEKL